MSAADNFHERRHGEIRRAHEHQADANHASTFFAALVNFLMMRLRLSLDR